MSWEEIEDLASEVLRVGNSEVRLIAKYRTWGQKKLFYQCRFYLGKGVMQQLGWTTASKVKFLWGTDQQLGLLRIVPVRDPAQNGWSVLPRTNGRAVIVNKALPKSTNTVVSHNTVVDYTVQPTSTTTGPCLQLTLPTTFYGTVLPAQTEGIAATCSAIHSATPLVLANRLLGKSTSTPNELDFDTTTRLDPAGLCQYIRRYMGEDARVNDARTIYINDDQRTHNDALRMVNHHRKAQGRDKFELQAQV